MHSTPYRRRLGLFVQVPHVRNEFKTASESATRPSHNTRAVWIPIWAVGGRVQLYSIGAQLCECFEPLTLAWTGFTRLLFARGRAFSVSLHGWRICTIRGIGLYDGSIYPVLALPQRCYCVVPCFGPWLRMVWSTRCGSRRDRPTGYRQH